MPPHKLKATNTLLTIALALSCQPQIHAQQEATTPAQAKRQAGSHFTIEVPAGDKWVAEAKADFLLYRVVSAKKYGLVLIYVGNHPNYPAGLRYDQVTARELQTPHMEMFTYWRKGFMVAKEILVRVDSSLDQKMLKVVGPSDTLYDWVHAIIPLGNPDQVREADQILSTLEIDMPKKGPHPAHVIEIRRDVR